MKRFLVKIKNGIMFLLHNGLVTTMKKTVNSLDRMWNKPLFLVVEDAEALAKAVYLPSDRKLKSASRVVRVLKTVDNWRNWSANGKETCLFVAVYFDGGYGDYLMSANFFEYFREKFAGPDVYFDFYGADWLKDVYNFEIPNLRLLSHSDFAFDYAGSGYDLVFKIAKRNQLIYADEERIEEISPSLFEYVQLCKKYIRENQKIFDANPRLDGLTSAESERLGRKRIQEPDIYGYFGVGIDFKIRIQINEDEDAYLDSIGLGKQKFILVHRGWCSAEDKGENVKVWSLESCGDLIPRFKQCFPDYKIVLFGELASQAPRSDGADLNLLEKTTLDQAKVLLKHASLLVDNEGGMVHLRHALKGGPSVVLFGPTSKAVFGYPENENISSSACDHWCEWQIPDWQYVCARLGKPGHPCMDAIRMEDVLAAAHRILDRGAV